MQIIKLYKYKRENGGTTVSPVMPDCEYTKMVRLVAEEGKELTKNGENFTTCVDSETAEGWYEVDVVTYAEAIDPAELNRHYIETDEPIEILEDPDESEE